jgi:hypothetical protein
MDSMMLHAAFATPAEEQVWLAATATAASANLKETYQDR